ncbi:TOMM precursor leader peptide-binding protein [Streptacidiphilus sp. PB12-B1b]|uniref:TOMM precursor leader peptide-binding protein n=1 Tax=Streptacidiphilus sp. PB12-B1b TaxID=2705012 RepID=UPI0015F7B0DF|nr:TOMM precursor leader peptide-binding protein [Streptacidiphilus sp. PB12-B1b]QMU78093.1 TOMM precursor leader peptide-binding protein [Streptacidiphilus sp. PB12-B1b]
MNGNPSGTALASRTDEAVLRGAKAPADLLALPWAEQRSAELVAVAGGYDARWERQALDAARDRGATLLSVRTNGTQVVLGPLWSPDRPSGCSGCAQVRGADREAMADMPFPGRPLTTPPPDPAETPAPTSRAGGPVLAPAVRELLAELLRRDGLLLAPGELLVLGPDGSLRRHRVLPSHRCEVCGEGPRLRAGRADAPPPPRELQPRPTAAALPDRGEPPFGLDPGRMRAALADPRFGPMLRIQRDGMAGMAMAEINLLGAVFAGHGRGTNYRHAEVVACLEAYERIGGLPHVAPIVFDASARELGDRAIDLSGLGHYTARQWASPLCRLRPFDQDTPMDWVWGHELESGRPLLVPADIGFYQYQYGPLAHTPEGIRRTRFFHESSSGSALGGSYEEAALHALLELAERDAFLLCWHRQQPLPRIAPSEITDRECLLLTRQIEEQGYEVHLLVATRDIAVPVVWAMAVRPDGRMPTSFNSAGASADPVQAAKSALWELSQLVGVGVDWDVEELRPLVDDPWLVDELLDHHKRSTYPELLPRVRSVLDGPVVSLAEAFPGWPGVFTDAAGGDVTGALRFLADLFHQAGLERIVLVDQSTPEHTTHGMAAVKAVVPGILPMCFGQAQQRLAGLPRLAAALTEAHGTPPRDEDAPYEPHPFP